jgi:hypothetical protein
MATPEEIAALRILIGEPNDVPPWTDAVLAAIIDEAAGDMDQSAIVVWEGKAASAASYVDTTESGSSRRMSQLHDQALKMVAYYRGRVDTPTQPPDLSGYAFTTGIERV